jgi:hypothetical protein
VSLHLTSQANSLMTVTSISVCLSMKQYTTHLLTVPYHMAIHSATTTSIASQRPFAYPVDSSTSLSRLPPSKRDLNAAKEPRLILSGDKETLESGPCYIKSGFICFLHGPNHGSASPRITIT